MTQLSRNHGDKAKAGVGNQDPPTRHAAANSDTLQDTGSEGSAGERMQRIQGVACHGGGGGVKDQRIQ